jgi:hypothetical protein
MDDCYDSDGRLKKHDKMSHDSEDDEYYSIFEGGPILMPNYDKKTSKGHERKLFNINSKSKRKHLQEG